MRAKHFVFHLHGGCFECFPNPNNIPTLSPTHGLPRKNDFFSLDLTTYTWEEMPCLGTPPSPRYFHSCCIYADRLYLYGGYNGSVRLADIFCYDFETQHFAEIDSSIGDAPSGRSSLVCQVHENSLYVFGGYNGTNVYGLQRRERVSQPVCFRVRPLSSLVHLPSPD